MNALRPHPILVLLVALLAACSSSRQSQPMDPGASIDLQREQIPDGRSLRVRGERTVLEPGPYLRPALSALGAAHGVQRGQAGVILIEDLHGATVDLSGVELRGAPRGTDPDAYEGWGIVVRDSSDVTLLGGTVGGYKGCLVIENSHGIVVSGMTFDGWFGQRLLSTSAAENLGDRLHPQENEQGQWLANYGAAISATNSTGVVINGCKGRHGQNGILLTRCERFKIYDNDFSFLSGWGLALYRSSENTVSHNIFDYCVRGFSEGVYWLGQSSAGMLVFEQSCDNVFAQNSASHSGSGVFLYGGQDLARGHAAERGEFEVGGSDRNLWYRNDLSYSVASGMEATFSSHNVLLENDLSGSHQHGIVAGYSSNMVMYKNRIDDTRGSAISIHHSQECTIVDNSFRNDWVGIEFSWSDNSEYVGGPFGQLRDTSSRNHQVVRNRFIDNDQDLRLSDSTALIFGGNRYEGFNRSLDVSEGIAAEGAPGLPAEDVKEWLYSAEGISPSGRVVRSTLNPWKGQEPAAVANLHARIAQALPGQATTWSTERGLRRSLDTIVMGEWGPWDYLSGEDRPQIRQPGGLLAAAQWDAVWFKWDTTRQDPRADIDAWRALRFRPIARKTVANFTHPIAGEALRALLGTEYFGIVANCTFDALTGGPYCLTVVSGDGVRVRLDGEVVLEDWTQHDRRTQRVEIDLTAGSHRLELEYFQVQGACALSLDIESLQP